MLRNDRFGIPLTRIRIRHVVMAAKMISVLVFIFSALQIALKWADYSQSRSTYEEIREIVHDGSSSVLGTLNNDKGMERSVASADKSSNPSANPASADVRKTAAPKERAILPMFIPLLKMNDDTVGWIQIEGTRIDYPIVQAKDNDFYLDHDFKKNRSSGGAIFMDYRNGIDPIDQNTVLYGHHMKDGSMFKDLVKFQDKAFLQNHPTIHLKTKYEDTIWRIFAIYVTDVGFDYTRPQYKSDDDFHLFVDTIKSKAKLPDEWTIGKEERILTLSTCSYDFGNARLVVQAVLDDSSK
jgi:sortase B